MSDTEVRLIDANSFKRFLQALCEAGAPYDDVIQLLDKQPTAFDVEKVIEEFLVTHIRGLTIDKAIDIVRKGGVNE